MKRAAIAILFLSMVTLAGGYASAFLPGGPPRWVASAFAVATAASMIAVLMLGAARRGGKTALLLGVFAFCFLCVAGGFLLALQTAPVSANATLFLGLPPGAAIILFVVGLPPMIVLPLVYALTFENVTLNTAELDELRAKLADMRQELK